MVTSNYAELIQEVRSAIMSRALRLAATQTTGEPKITVVPAGATPAAIPSGKTGLIIELDDATIAAFSEKLTGIKNPVGKFGS